MYPAVTDIVREAIRLRYRLLPYFYTLLWQASVDDEPMLRPTFLDHEHDAHAWQETDDFLIGRDLLVASVVEPGQRQRRVWLPDNGTGWYCFWGGQWITLDAPLERLPLLARAGAGLPMSQRLAHVDAAADNQRELRLFPLSAGESEGMLFEDDGESYGWREGDALWLRWRMTCDATRITLNIAREGRYQPAWRQLEIVLPSGERRELWINGEAASAYRL